MVEKSKSSEKIEKEETSVKPKTKSKNFVVVNINNFQEKVSEGDIVEVYRVGGDVGNEVKYEEVLLCYNQGKTVIGKPYVSGAEVIAEILEHSKGDKIHSRTFKAKSRYRRHVGHRQPMSKIKISKIKFQ